MYLHIASTAPKRAAMTTALVDPTMMKVVVSERIYASQSQPQQLAITDRQANGHTQRGGGGIKDRQTDR